MGQGPPASGPTCDAPGGRYRLRGVVGGAGRSYPVGAGDTRIGSVRGNDIVLPVRGVSRRHALLSLGAEGLTVEDLQSRNGVVVNGVRVHRARLKPGDEVSLGPVVLRLEEFPAEEQPPAAGPEPAPVVAAMLASGALIAQLVAGKAARDALFLSAFDVRSLPPVMMASAIFAMAAVLVFSRALARHSPARVVPIALSLSAGLLTAEWGLSLLAPRAAALLVYLHMAVFGATLISGFWSLANERFDPYTARRVMARIGTGASIGGVTGGILAWGGARVVQVPAMLVLIAAINVVGLLAVLRLRRGAGTGETGSDQPAPAPASALEGIRILRDVPYVRDLAWIVGLVAIAESLFDYNLKAGAAASLPRGPALMAFFALFHGGVGLAALIVQGSLARRSLDSLGLAGTVALLPGVVALGAVGGLLSPRLLSAVLARGAQAALQGSLFRSGYELLFTALAKNKKRPTKMIVDVGFDKLGTLAGSALALSAVAVVPQATQRVLFGLCLAAAVTALALSRRLHRGYVVALEENLRSGAVRLDPAAVVDSTTRFALAQTGLFLEGESPLRGIEAVRGAMPLPPTPLLRALEDLRSGDPQAARRALVGSGPLDPRLAAFVIPLLGRNDLYSDALRALREIAPRATGQLADALLAPDQERAVRRRLPRVLSVCDTQRAADGLLAALRDADFEVRYNCGLALIRITDRTPGVFIPAESAFGAALQELGLSSSLADERSVEKRLDHVFNVLSLALEREPLWISRRAIRSAHPLRGTALEYLENVLPADIRDALWPLLGVPLERPRAQRPRQEVVEELRREGPNRKKAPTA